MSDQIGTPQELTDEADELTWSARYQAWGEAQEMISEAARTAGIANPLRFTGQYFDRETGLHYNRHRYYDPGSGRFVSKDPIGLQGGLNVYQYASNPIEWIDPLGLAKNKYQIRRPPKGAHDPLGAKAPGKPGKAEGFCDCNLGETWAKLDDGRGSGWVDKSDNVWVPTGLGADAHGGPHWDVQMPGGECENVYPGGRRR